MLSKTHLKQYLTSQLRYLKQEKQFQAMTDKDIRDIRLLAKTIQLKIILFEQT